MTDRRSLEIVISGQLLALSREWRDCAGEAIAASGLSYATGWILVQAAEMGRDGHQVDIARRAGIQSGTLVRLLDQLETAGLVTRERQACDRRSKKIILTERGREIVGTVQRELNQARARFFEALPDDELQSAESFLLRLHKSGSTHEGRRV
ncbi:MarR family winged helix-turn-helix transcriptional regulator [Sphingobium sp. CCH11-B1]|uniref:MarR family winged helix-turn-helix transcriptional regulator n=1 Tax=Sphingobium sp. CCH11-B1 TaxID=1768781 RepID=UPI000833A483|nr:MarR family transcriptional regulator [Sphingobium sp. CCH11-B1]